MVETVPTSKRVIVHVGPHKTGSTAIQFTLKGSHKLLMSEGVHVLHDALTHEAAACFAQDKVEDAISLLKEVSTRISQVEASTVILSQEDFCGDLPGRSGGKSVYPKLTRNFRAIADALQPHAVEFVFFLRKEENWMESCYHQNLLHRTRFASLDAFLAHFDEPLSWSKRLHRPMRVFGDALHIVPYSKDRDAGMQSILKLLKVGKSPKLSSTPEVNPSPSQEQVRLLERVNSLSSFKSTAWFAKTLIASDWKPRPIQEISYPRMKPNTLLAAAGLPDLSRRSVRRIVWQQVSDVMPPENVDLSEYIFDILPTDITLPPVPRTRMEDQARILSYHLRGKSRLAWLNALTISYLRRDTAHTDKARHLFHRIWRENGILLMNELTTRWLISTLQTFLDHGQNEAQRLIGASGHFYANMMKIYEGERSIEGRPQDAIYEKTEPQTPNKFHGLDRFNVGGTDLMLNTNALALDLAMRDDVAGMVLIELLLRVKNSGNVFTRMDRTRQAKGIEVKDFADTWSFFEAP